MALMNKRYLVLLALLACLTGCVPVDSLNPLYTDKDLAFDESLLGSWVGPDNGDEGVTGDPGARSGWQEKLPSGDDGEGQRLERLIKGPFTTPSWSN